MSALETYYILLVLKLIDMFHLQSVLGSQHFIGPQPVSIEYRHFDQLKNNRYVVCEKTDGIRHYMVALDGTCTFINRALQGFTAQLKFDVSVFKGTILDGELCDNIFVVYDALEICGQNVMHLHFLDRYALIEKTLKTLITLKSSKIKVTLKKFFPLHDFKTFRDEHIPTVTQKMDGLIFTPVDVPICLGTHETMFKWKPKEKNTIDFLMKDAGNAWRLYVQEKGQLIYESEFPKKLMDEPWFKNDIIVECQYMTEDSPLWWKPLLVRSDKTHPNNRRTFYRTLVNIKEDIKLDEFLKCT